MKNHPAYGIVFENWRRGESLENVCTMLDVTAAIGAIPNVSKRFVERLYRGFESGLLGG
jgi:hypothetical protein